MGPGVPYGTVKSVGCGYDIEQATCGVNVVDIDVRIRTHIIVKYNIIKYNMK